MWWAALVLVAAGCDNPGAQQGTPSAAPVASAAPSGRVVATPVPSASVSAVASASSAPAAGDGWSGDYTAKKAEIEMPDKVKDLTWKRDPGDKLIGPGKLTLRIEEGVVSGSAAGALGEQIVTGTVEGKSLKFSLLPKNATAGDAMTGTGVGEVTATSITGTMRCSSPDAVIIREATFELKQGK
jgi:hypothetical protein